MIQTLVQHLLAVNQVLSRMKNSAWLLHHLQLGATLPRDQHPQPDRLPPHHH